MYQSFGDVAKEEGFMEVASALSDCENKKDAETDSENWRNC
ncbi:MAG: hypothetical protein ACLTCI_11235 [[Clostridium] nexile]